MRIFRKAARLTFVAALGLLAFHACSSSVMEPQADGSTTWESLSFQDETPARLGAIDIEAAYAEPVVRKPTSQDFYAKPTDRWLNRLLTFAESNDDELEVTGRKWTIVSRYISAEDGGIIEFGNEKVGYSTIEFAPGALEEDQLITVVHKLRGKRDIFFFEEGLVFKDSVTVKFNLVGLSSRQKDKLLNMRLWYHNPDVGGWELVESSSDGEWVTANLEHFSRYAIGSDE